MPHEIRQTRIDVSSMRHYKANLTIVAGRYGDLERRVLRYFVDNPGSKEIALFGGLDLLLSNLFATGSW